MMTYISGMLECLIAHAFTLLEGFLGDSALFFELILQLATMEYVSHSELEGVKEPLEQFG